MSNKTNTAIKEQLWDKVQEEHPGWDNDMIAKEVEKRFNNLEE